MVHGSHSSLRQRTEGSSSPARKMCDAMPPCFPCNEDIARHVTDCLCTLSTQARVSLPSCIPYLMAFETHVPNVYLHLLRSAYYVGPRIWRLDAILLCPTQGEWEEEVAW